MTTPATPEETEDEKRMRQMMASMRGGIIPSLNEDADKDDACVLSDETLDRREHGVEMLENIAKMREAQHGREAFLALARGEERKIDLDTLVDLFGAGTVKTDQEYCKHCATTIWHDQTDGVWRHTDGELTTCGYGGSALAEPVVRQDDVDTSDITMIAPPLGKFIQGTP